LAFLLNFSLNEGEVSEIKFKTITGQEGLLSSPLVFKNGWAFVVRAIISKRGDL
jgi:hypothetical protein